MLRFAMPALVLCAACGSDSKKSPDAAAQIDAVPSTIVPVSCTGITPAATVTINSTGDGYMPATTMINQGQIVLFMTTSIHDVFPGHATVDSTITDSGIHVDFSMTGCRQFTATGSYGFHCSIHLFNGTITVN
jgi:plastocyanin